jgi:hypothetical protein
MTCPVDSLKFSNAASSSVANAIKIAYYSTGALTDLTVQEYLPVHCQQTKLQQSYTGNFLGACMHQPNDFNFEEWIELS